MDNKFYIVKLFKLLLNFFCRDSKYSCIGHYITQHHACSSNYGVFSYFFMWQNIDPWVQCYAFTDMNTSTKKCKRSQVATVINCDIMANISICTAINVFANFYIG